MAKKSILQTIRNWLTGGSSSGNKSSGKASANIKKASRVSNYGGGYSSSYRARSEEDEKEKQRQKLAEQNKQTTAKLAAIAKVSQRTDALSSGKKSLPPEPKALANNGVERAVRKIGEKSKAPDPKQAAARSAKERAEATRKNTAKALRVKSPEEMIASGDYQRAEAPRNANTRSADERPSVVLSRQGLEKQYADPAFANAQTVARRLVGGASLGTLKPLLKGGSDSPYEQMQEEVYQQHENKLLGGVAELAGSALTFGLTAGATDALGGQIMSKVAPRAAERIGESAIGRGLATRAVNSQIKKGVAKEATEELIKKVGREKAEQILARLGGETVQNLSTGAIYDIANATSEYELFSPEWWDEVKRSAKFNAGITGVLTALPVLGAGNKKAVLNSLDALADNGGIREAAGSAVDSIKGASGNRIAEIDRELDELYNTIARNGDMSEEGLNSVIKRTSELKAERAALEEGANAVQPPRPDVDTAPPKLEDADAEMRAEAKEVPTEVKKPAIEETPAEAPEPPRTKGDVRQELKALREEHWNLAEEIKAEYGDANPRLEELSEAERKVFFEQKARLREISEQIDTLTKELDEVPEGAPRANPEPVKNAEPSKPVAEETVEEPKPAVEEMAEEPRVEEPRVEEPRVEESAPKAEEPRVEPTEEGVKKEPPKKKLSKEKLEEQRARKKWLERRAKDAKYQETFEEYRARLQSETGNQYNTRAGAKAAEAMASDEEADRIIKQTAKEMNDLDNGAISDGMEIGYKRLSKGERDEIIRNSYDRVSKDAQAVIDELNGYLDSTRPLAIQDVADVVALRNYYKSLGKELPSAWEETCSRILLRQRTEAGQLVNAVELLMKENSPEWRRKFIDRNFEKFRELVCRQDNWNDIKRSLNENHKDWLKDHGETDWLEAQLKELSDPTKWKDATEADYKKAIRDLQHQIFVNSEPSKWDVLNMIRYTAMLSKPATALRNIYGNVSQALMYDIADKINIAIESGMEKRIKASQDALTKEIDTAKNRLKALKKGSDAYNELKKNIDSLEEQIDAKKKFERTTTLVTDKKQLAFMNELTEGKAGGTGKLQNKGIDDDPFYQKLREYLKDDHPEMMGEPKYGQKSSKGSEYIYKNNGKPVKRFFAKIGQAGGKYTDITLNEPDSWFVERNYRKALMKYLKANGIESAEALEKNPEVVKRARAHAMEVAKENTYKRNYRATEFFERLRAKGYNKKSSLGAKATTVFLDAEAPFLKVPINMIVNNFKYNPVNLVYSGGKAIAAAKNGDVRALQKECAELSKSLTGTGLAVLGYFLTVDEQGDEGTGLIASAKDDLKPYGVRDYSLQIGNHNMSLADVGIGVPQLMMGVRAAEIHNESGGAPSDWLDKMDNVAATFGATVDVVGDQSMLDNLMDIIDAASQGYDYGKGVSGRLMGVGTKVMTDYVGQPIPTWLRGIAGGMTSSDLDTGVKKGDTGNLQRQLQRTGNNLISALPVINEKVLPHKVDAHGNYVNERKTAGEKAGQVAKNLLDPLATKKVNIPKADKIELSVKDEQGRGYVPKAFDKDRTFQATIGKGDNKETFDLTGKEREQAAHSVKKSGKDMAHALVYSKKGFLGDSHSDRAQQILRECPEDEEKAREYLYNLPEYKNLKTDEERRAYMDALYLGGSGSGGDKNYGGRERTSNRYVYVDLNGHSDDEFRFVNDLTDTEQANYSKAGLEGRGVDKGTYADAIQAIHDAEHEYKNGENIDTINGKKNIVAGILSLGLDKEQNIAIFEAVRGNRNWKDWDGVSGVASGWRRYGRRYRYHGHGGGSSAKAKVPAPKKISASKFEKGEALVSKRRTSRASSNAPVLERVEAKIDLPTVRYSKKNRG